MIVRAGGAGTHRSGRLGMRLDFRTSDADCLRGPDGLLDNDPDTAASAAIADRGIDGTLLNRGARPYPGTPGHDGATASSQAAPAVARAASLRIRSTASATDVTMANALSSGSGTGSSRLPVQAANRIVVPAPKW